MNSTLRLACCCLTASLALGQSWVGFPAAAYDAWESGGGADAAVASLCHPSAQLAGIKATTEVRDGNGWSFRGFASHGVLAVFRPEAQPVGGISTGFAGVTGLDVAQDMSLPEGYRCLIVTGYTANGPGSVRGFFYDAVGPQGPATGTWFDFPSGAQPGAGEIFVTASLLGDELFVQEGTTGQILRFLDLDSDGMPESRSPTFAVPVPVAPIVLPGPIDRFRFHPAFVVRTFVRHPARDRMSGVVSTVSGGLEYQHAQKVPALPAIAYPRLPGGSPVGGQSRIMVAGLPTQDLVLDAATSESGPWSVLSAGSKTPSSPDISVTLQLSGPLVGGNWVRARDLVTGATTPPHPVLPSQPILHTRFSGVLSGSSFQLEGDNLSPQTTARFRPFGPSTDISLSVTPLTSTSVISLTAPTTTVHLQGFCVLEAPGQRSVSFFLMVSP